MEIFKFSALAWVMLAYSMAAANDTTASSEASDRCPVSLAPDGAGEPGSRYFYCSDTFGVFLPSDGTWPTTAPNARIAVKVFWSSSGYRPGMEEHLHVDIKNLNGATNDATVKDTTNANSPREDYESAQFDDEWQNGWMMLTGIDFPSAGCWQISGKYLDQSLTFVIQTAD